jgi:ATP-dependent helicase HrpA
VRLYDEASFASRQPFTDPEIKRTGLAGVILRMKSLGLGRWKAFPSSTRRSRRRSPRATGSSRSSGRSTTSELTKLGKQLARFPVDPRIGRMILAGADQRCLREVLVVAAALNVQDPRERPREQRQKADELHRRFADERSDFVSLLRLWDFVREAEKKGSSNLRRVCRDGFLSWIRVREWTEIHRQLEDIVRSSGSRNRRLHRPSCRAPSRTRTRSTARSSRGSSRRSGSGTRRPACTSARGRRGSPPSVVVARAETAAVDHGVRAGRDDAALCAHGGQDRPRMAVEAAPHLLKRSYSEPHWSEKSARASIKEHVTLLGLTVAKDRSVDYASVAPGPARQMFLDHALVRGEYRSRGAFQEKNRALLETVAKLRDKARMSDMMADDDALLAFFDRRVPDTVVNGERFEVWREEAEKTNPAVLQLTLADVLIGDQALTPESYPDTLELHGARVSATYKFDPSAEDDGVRSPSPSGSCRSSIPGELDWTMPGLAGGEDPLLPARPSEGCATRDLGRRGESERRRARARRDARAVRRAHDARAREGAVDADFRACHSRSLSPGECASAPSLLIEVLGDGERVVAEGRDLAELQRQLGVRARAALKSSAPERPAERRWERAGLTGWDFGELPPFVVRRVAGADVRTYPAVVDNGSFGRPRPSRVFGGGRGGVTQRGASPLHPRRATRAVVDLAASSA